MIRPAHLNSLPPRPAKHGLRSWPALVVVLVGFMLVGCGRRDDVHVRLEILPGSAKDLSRLEIRAQVSGPLAGLTYKWICDSGQCNPQESDLPGTIYVFAEGAKTDRLVVEAWMGNQRVAKNEIEVQRPIKTRKPTLPAAPIQIEITQIPPYEPQGGANTRSDIAGKVSGPVSAADEKVIIYSRAHDVWYIQPGSHSVHDIQPDNTWSGWTHKGSSYAAFVVRQSYIPVFTLDVLPRVGGDILARVIEEGTRSTSAEGSEAAGGPAVPGAAETETALGAVLPDGIPIATTTLRVKAGAKTPFTDNKGVVWQPDEGLLDGVSADRDVALPVENTETPELYRSERYDITRFQCQIPSGKYLVKLHFAEMYAKIKKPGQRVFSVRVEGKEYKNLDILSLAGGPRRAYIQTIPTTVLHGSLNITFIRKTQVPFVNAIEITPDVTAP